MRILVVEDEEALSRVLSEKLELAHFSVRVAKDGEEAIPFAKEFLPDLVLLDLLLPKKLGMDVLEEMKQDQDLKTIPVIIISNLGSDEDIKRALSLGAVDYFVKTQHPLKEIVEKVKKYAAMPK